MEQPIDETPVNNAEIQILSPRNRKRFNKLLPQIESVITQLKNDNQELKKKIENVKDFEISWEVASEKPYHLRYVIGDSEELIPEIKPR
jgi:hypothetical protein